MEEPMEVETTFREEECGDEAGGAVDSDEGVIERDSFAVESRHENKGGAFTTGIDIFGVEERRRMQERAKRFGLSERDAGAKDEEELYSSMGVVEDNENSKHIRLNVLHMRGTEEMSTKDVFKYFEHYPPAAIEWINDVSCNVVWLDNVSAARALLGLSKRIIGLPDHLESEAMGKYTHEDNLIEVGDPKNESTIHLKDVECPLPPGLWRKGHDSPKSKGIFLRFATRNDKKQPRAEKMSKYYKKYGNPNFGGMRGILTETRKRQYKQIRITKPRGSSENGNGENEGAKNPWGELSENWGAHEDVEDNYIRGGQSERQERGSVKGRLGLKPTILGREVERPAEEVEVSLSEDSESSDSEAEWARRSKIPRMRMHADDEEEKVKKKKLKLMTRKVQEESADLRSRLGRRKPHPIYREDIQVIVTNNPEKYRARKAREEPEDVEEAPEEEVEEEEEEEVEEMEEEKEEGEWEDVEEESESSSSDSDISEKEIQGPKGSVIKVVPRSKPRVASTVWARLNVKGQTDNSSVDSGNSRKLRGDLRSRLGQQKRERSPLRIEVKNEKYKKRDESD